MVCHATVRRGEEVTAMVEESLSKHGIDIADCYDNGTGMAGKVKGVLSLCHILSVCGSDLPGLPRNRHILWLYQSTVQAIQSQESYTRVWAVLCTASSTASGKDWIHALDTLFTTGNCSDSAHAGTYVCMDVRKI